MTHPSSPATANTRRYSCARRARDVGADPRRRAARRGPPLRPIRRGGHHLAAIAAEAGAAVETIYTGFSSTKALLRAAMDVAIVGDAQPVPLIER